MWIRIYAHQKLAISLYNIIFDEAAIVLRDHRLIFLGYFTGFVKFAVTPFLLL